MKRFLAIAAALIACWLILYGKARPDNRLHLYFLNIGQGDSILIRTPQGKNILVDGGPGDSVLDELGQTLPYWDRGLDFVILTHPDRDHLEGIIPVLARFKVHHVFMTGALSESNLSKKLVTVLMEENIPFSVADASSDFSPDAQTHIDFIFPLSSGIRTMEKTNNTSLMFILEYQKQRMLFTGDIEAPVEEFLLRSEIPLDADLLKVAHHGSKTSSTEAFLRAVSPETCVISAGRGNRYGHPHTIVLVRLERNCKTIRRTDIEGRVEMTF